MGVCYNCLLFVRDPPSARPHNHTNEWPKDLYAAEPTIHLSTFWIRRSVTTTRADQDYAEKKKKTTTVPKTTKEKL